MTICPNVECRHLMITIDTQMRVRGTYRLLECPFCGARKVLIDGWDEMPDIPKLELLTKPPKDGAQKAKAKKLQAILDKAKGEKK